MNWKKILANIAGVALTCATAHHAMQPAGADTDWRALGVGVALCIGANLLGLGQNPPHQD
jgi:hypothetical protein